MLLGFIAVATIKIALAPLALWRHSDHRGHHPPAADQEQLFKGVLDWIICSNLFGGQAKPSAIALGSRLIIEANGIAQTLDQGVKQKSLAAVVGNSGYDFNDDIITLGATLWSRVVERKLSKDAR